MIQFSFEDIAPIELQLDKLSYWIKETVHLKNRQTGDIHFILCNDDKILEVNRQFLNHDYFTDIITFDYSERNRINGDIYISLDTVASNAISYNSDFEEEIKRIIIHGVLHLCGQNDKTEDESREMTRLENEALDRLKELG